MKLTENTKYVLNTDGGARGNPGPAASAAVFYDVNGNVVAELSEYLGTATNNVAEYRGLLLGLQEAVTCGVIELEIRMDSELIVKQLRGEYKVQEPTLQGLNAKANELIRSLKSVTISHVPRAQNKEADRLVNICLDAKSTNSKF